MAEAAFEGWALLEVMGHRRLAGFIRESSAAGVPLLRIDVPEHDWRDGCTCGGPAEDTDHEKHQPHCQMFRDPDADAEPPADVHATQFYAASAIYCVTPTSEKTARRAAQLGRPRPVSRWELEAPVDTGADEEVPF